MTHDQIYWQSKDWLSYTIYGISEYEDDNESYISKQGEDYKPDCTDNTWGASWVLKVDGYTLTYHKSMSK